MRRALSALIPVAVLAASLSACGGSSSSPESQSRHGGDSGFAVINGGALVRGGQKSTHAQTTVAAHDPISYSRRPSHARLAPDGQFDDESQATGAKPVNPCALVTKSEAHSIVRLPIVRAWLAPQGPTCIYEVSGAKSYITLAVQDTALSAVRKHARAISRRTTRGRASYCLKLGTTMTVVQLSSRRVLRVTAPCSIGSRFAAKALTRR